MREFKFRSWDGEEMFKKGVVFNVVNSTLSGDHYSINQSHCFKSEIMQAIDIKDENGVEIYEGDTVKYLFPKTPHCQEHEETIGVVEYIDCSASYRVVNPWHGDLPIHEDVQLFVIGNKYENPEIKLHGDK
tara:strand:- start:290 stop:682 length:393 start_codon:yes stop_codon:yes gene_type:complete